MKKLLCLALMLALGLAALSGCSRGGGQEDAAPAEGSFEPESGPGYTITDGSSAGGQSEAASPASDSADGLGDDQPTPEPVETLPPETLELEMRNAGMEAEGGEGANDASGGDSGGFDVNAASGGEDIALGTYDEATDTAQHAAPSLIDTNSYQYSAVMDENVDYTFYYPSHWQNVPGIYTICFREPVEKGDFPARIAVTRKRLVHTPDDEALMDQLISYIKSIRKQYDKATFQTSTPNKEDTFMGQRAFSNTYLAYWGDVEVKGFVIGTAIERTLYVFHFSATYADYLAMQNMLQYIVKSVKQKEPVK